MDADKVAELAHQIEKTKIELGQAAESKRLADDKHNRISVALANLQIEFTKLVAMSLDPPTLDAAQRRGSRPKLAVND